MARRMAEEAFHQGQCQNRYSDHIAPFNRLVDELRTSSGRGWVPHVAPMYGGVQARLLSILSDPGPSTREGQGSGFLCMENDDPTAETICGHFARVQIEARDIIPWNAYPWYINQPPNVAQLEAGIAPLKQVISLMPRLQVVMLHGVKAKEAWRRFLRHHPRLVSEAGLTVISTYHTGRQAFLYASATEREARRAHLRAAFDQAARRLKSPKAE